MSTAEKIPVVILAGADSGPRAVPRGLGRAAMLVGYKGIQILPWGRCLAAELVARLQASGRFAEPLLLGPRDVYAGQVPCEVVHVAGSLADTLETTIATMLKRYGATAPVALTACDILPTAAELRELMATGYDPCAESVFWGQVVQAEPEQMGASRWKPRYMLRPTPADNPVNVYPGHLVIVRPVALRLGLASRLLHLAYRYRNRPLHQRLIGLTLRSLGLLLAEDVRNVVHGQWPVLTATLPVYGWRAVWKLRARRLTLADFEYYIARAFLHRRFHHAGDGRPVAFPLTTVVSFAKDIDTQAELDEAVQDQPCDSD